MTNITEVSSSSSHTSQDALVGDIPPAILGYLREIAKADFERSFLKTVLLTAILAPLVIRMLDFDLEVIIIGIVAAGAAVTFSFGHILRGQDRREQRLVNKELEYRRFTESGAGSAEVSRAHLQKPSRHPNPRT